MKEVYSNSKEFGPPGINTFRKVLQREYPQASMAAMEWACRAILSQMAHKTMLTHTPMFQAVCDQAPGEYNMELFEVFIEETINAILDRLTSKDQDLEAKIIARAKVSK